MRLNVSHVNRSIRFAYCRQRKNALTAWPRLSAAATWRHQSTIPFRKQLKDEAKLRKVQGALDNGKPTEDTSGERWELTVGLEIHAQLNSDKKLFSGAPTSAIDELNSHTALFDLSVPGSLPRFQKAALLPALRAAVALNCNVQHESSFDRKHYFYHDQPAGYQITQYYNPLAKNGSIILTEGDGIAPEDYPSVEIGIKQIQLEQDTAKTTQQPPDDVLLDFNRVGHPLIEIITLPHIHSPQTAAACVRKIQNILTSVSAVTAGMELGGLRADVNVSVRQRGSTGTLSYSGVSGLGQRTEIKNLSSFKAVEDAIIAERSRQISILEQGGSIEGETRGWTLGSTETRRLRGKEGEVDYRYLPDPDIPALLISQNLVEHIRDTLPMLPDEQVSHLTSNFDITPKDARTLVTLDNGIRLDYMFEVLNGLADPKDRDNGRIVSNWILHELGGLLSTHGLTFEANPVPASAFRDILGYLKTGGINGNGAKMLLGAVFAGDRRSIDELVEIYDLNIMFSSPELEEYKTMASQLLQQYPEKAAEIREGKTGKLQWFVGQMMRASKGKMDAKVANSTLVELLGI